MLQRILFSMLITLHALLLAAGAVAVQCPSNCKCSWVLDSLEADCSHSGLTVSPNFNELQIQHLVLSHNHITVFPAELVDLTSLIYLDLSNNQIESIDGSALLGFTTLRTLNLANNSFTGWLDLQPNVLFRSAISLQRLVLSGNALKTFTSDNPKEMLISESLKHLELQECGIKVVGGDVLMNGLPNLEYLQLSGNTINTIAALPSKSLRVLVLRHCNLQRINKYFLQSLPNLEVLNLSWNSAIQLGTSDDDVITSHTLNELDLSYCNLDDINTVGLPSLSTMNLRGNLLRAVNGNTFANNTLLEVIDLARNSLRVIEANTFAGLKRLTALDLSYNEIARLDLNVFRTNDVLTELNLSHNIFDKFTKLISNSLVEINLSWCLLIAIDGKALSGLTSIQRLDLSNNLLRDLPNGMHSETLKRLDLSNCKLSTIRNNTFREFPELASLRLNGNRFTTPFPAAYFASNRYLDEIWAGDNSWICNCNDAQFIGFYDYLTTRPQKLKDKNNLRCASPNLYYGKTWESACNNVWLPNGRSSSPGQVWSTIFYSILVIGFLVFLFSCLQRLMKKHKERSDSREYRQNQDEMMEIRRLNQRILQEDASGNAPNTFETNLPSYEDAILMPKLERPVKSMLDLTATERRQKKLKRARTHPEEEVVEEEEDDGLLLDNKQRFRSEEMLANRDKERTAVILPQRRTGMLTYANSGSRRLSIEAGRFTAFQMKSQNLQSAEKIGNFQSYENSPYTKRRSKIAEIPPFKRATLRSESVEFLTDPEYETQSKSNSPFARRKPKLSETQTPPASTATVIDFAAAPLEPAIENYFSSMQKAESLSSVGSDFQKVDEPDLSANSINKRSNSYTSNDANAAIDLERGKRKKRKNSASRRVSGNFSAAAAEANSSSSDCDPVVVVHKPMRETLF